MTIIDFKRHIELNEGYQGINLTEFTIEIDSLISNDQIISDFIHSEQFAFQSLRNCVKVDPDKDYLRQPLNFEKVRTFDFYKTDKQGASKFLF